MDKTYKRRGSTGSVVKLSHKALRFADEKSRFVDALNPNRNRSHQWKAWSGKENRKDYYAVTPPIDHFMDVNASQSIYHTWKGFQRDDVIIVRISSIREHGLSLVVISLDGGKLRDIESHKMRAWCPIAEIPKETNHEDVLLRFSSGDILRCVVVKSNVDDEELTVSMFRPPGFHLDVPLGKIEDEDLPLAYQRLLTTEDSYEHMLELSVGFVNPNNVEYLMSRLKIPQEEVVSLMNGLHKKHFAKEDYAEPLRKRQCRKVAEKNVKRGIEKFKANNYMEALQDFNHALDMDSENVDALVARGALYANRSSFARAINDFEGALKLQQDHRNAKKYLVEVLVERAKQIESDMKDVEQVKEVERCYRRALHLDPRCEEAIKAIGEIERKQEEDRKEKAKNEESSSDSSENGGQYAATAEKLRRILKSEPGIKKRTRSTSSKRGRRATTKKKRRSQTSKSPSSSSSSSSSTSSSSSSSSDSDTRSKKRRKKTKSSSSDSSSSSSGSNSDGKTKNTKVQNNNHRKKRRRRKSSSSSSSTSSSTDGEDSKNTKTPKKDHNHNDSASKLRHEHASKPRHGRTREKTPPRSRSRSTSFGKTEQINSRQRHSDIASDRSERQAIIRSNSRTRYDRNNFFDDRRSSLGDSARSLPRGKSESHSFKSDADKVTNLTKITKDNFENILSEITKFEGQQGK